MCDFGMAKAVAGGMSFFLWGIKTDFVERRREIEYVKEDHETNWMSTVGQNINEVERIACEKTDAIMRWHCI